MTERDDDSGKTPETWLAEPTVEPAEFVGDGVGIVSPGSNVTMDELGDFEVSAVILRACRECAGATELRDGEAWCAPCNLQAVTHDLGVVSAHYFGRSSRSRIRRAWWASVGRRRANRRIASANRHTLTT